MCNPKHPYWNKKDLMAGGHATSSGVTFQHEVGAWMAALILTERAASNIGPGTPVRIQLEALSPVDDIVVQTNEGGFWFINVKTGVFNSTAADSELSSVFGQFVRQWREGCSDAAGVAGGTRPLDPRRDRLVLVVRPGRSRAFTSSAESLLRRIADAQQDGGRAVVATTEAERAVLGNVREHVRVHWLKQYGADPRDEDVLSLLSAVSVVEFELAGVSRSALETLLQAVTPGAPSAALDTLVGVCGAFAGSRSGGGRETLRSALRARHVPLIALPSFQADIDRLRALSTSVLDDLKHYASIQVTGSSGVVEVVIDRACAQAVVDGALRKSFLVIGEPGAGKSGALHSAAHRLRQHGAEVIVLAVDQLNGSTSDMLRQELGLQHPITDIFSEWAPTADAVVFIDALDASRGGASEAPIRQFLHDMKTRAPHWKVVASIRKFDLRHGVKLHGIFDGEPVNPAFSDDEFSGVTHLNIPPLTHPEIESVRSQWPALDTAAAVASPEFRKLLQSPFNLHLLAQVLNKDMNLGGTAKTQLDLLRSYWLHRVEGIGASAFIGNVLVLTALIEVMLRQRRLSASIADIDATLRDDLARMLAHGVLQQAKGSQRVAFSHHMLFDFSLAKLKLLENGLESIGSSLQAAAEDMLLIAPAAMMAFRVAWDADAGRSAFWKHAIKLARQLAIGAFVRALPANVAAEAIRSRLDVQPLVDAVAERKSEGAEFLVQHVYGVLLAEIVPEMPRFGDDADPWLPITEALCERAVDRFIWPMNATIAEWAKSAERMSATQQRALNHCARLLLTTQEFSGRQYNDGAVSASVEAIARTFASAPVESAAALGVLLVEERVAAHGHRELFWIANHFRSLARQDPGFACIVLRTAYGTPLPSRDEVTSIGSSRILALTSNKRQDFRGRFLHLLLRNMAWFLEASPVPCRADRPRDPPAAVRRSHGEQAASRGVAVVRPKGSDGSGRKLRLVEPRW